MKQTIELHQQTLRVEVEYLVRKATKDTRDTPGTEMEITFLQIKVILTQFNRDAIEEHLLDEINKANEQRIEDEDERKILKRRGK